MTNLVSGTSAMDKKYFLHELLAEKLSVATSTAFRTTLKGLGATMVQCAMHRPLVCGGKRDRHAIKIV